MIFKFKNTKNPMRVNLILEHFVRRIADDRKDFPIDAHQVCTWIVRKLC